MDDTSRSRPALRLRAAVHDDLATFQAIDTDAAMLFEQAGLFLDLPDDHEFALTERDRWARSIAAGNALLALDAQGAATGFAALGERDGQPFLQQLSVRQASMRQGIGTVLLEAMVHAASHAGAAALWLTTYDHLPWNRPFYERSGFVRVKESDCGPELRQDLEYERRWLPQPEHRIAMCRLLPRVAGGSHP